MNNVVLIGRLVRDPELRYVPVSGRAVANFTLAVDKGLSRDKRQEMEAKGQPTADFIDIVVWGAAAENSAQYLQQGLQVAVQGRIQTGSYDDKQGIRRKTFEVVAERVEFIEWPDSPNQGGQASPGYGQGQPQNNQFNQNQGPANPINNDFSGIEGFHPTDDDDIPF